MVLIPAGTFLYGSSDDDPIASSDEEPQRVIDLPAFYMDVFPVTNSQFCEFLNNVKPNMDKLDKWIYLKNIYERCRIKRQGSNYNVENGYERHPVTSVTWYGANAYARWAGKRLPTEEEWEKAARGTDGRIYPWGDKFDASQCNSSESDIRDTTEVGKYPEGKSPYGCYDMAGNVWEWTSSLYAKGPIVKFYTIRGGSWFSGGLSCRCANRHLDPLDLDPSGWNYDIGFRCAKTP